MRRDNRPLLKMVMKPAQSVDVDRAVIHPDTLRDSGRLLETKEDLVGQIEYVAHFPEVPFLSVACGAHSAQIARIRKVGKLFDPVHGGQNPCERFRLFAGTELTAAFARVSRL